MVTVKETRSLKNLAFRFPLHGRALDGSVYSPAAPVGNCISDSMTASVASFVGVLDVSWKAYPPAGDRDEDRGRWW